MLLHASCVVIGEKAVLLAGSPGAGKSDLALRLIDGGARLLADDQTLLRCENKALIASPPLAIQGMLEIRHLGLVRLPFVAAAQVALYVDLLGLEATIERLPDPDFVFFLDQPVQRLRLPSFAASTPAKIRAALAYKDTDDRTS